MPYHYRYAPDEIPAEVEMDESNTEDDSKDAPDNIPNGDDKLDKVHNSSIPKAKKQSDSLAYNYEDREKRYTIQDRSSHRSTNGDMKVVFRKGATSSSVNHVNFSFLSIVLDSQEMVQRYWP